MRFLGLVAALALLAPAAPGLGCMPGCSGYHLTFTGPTGAGAVADRSLVVTWEDAVDGPNATFDLLASADPVPVYPMHSFPAQLPGQILALGLSATASQSFLWNTAQVPAGTYNLYAVFHNSPFNTLVLPFAAVAIGHDAQRAPSASALIGSPRGLTSVSGTVSVALDAVAAGHPDAVVDLYVGAPPEASDPTLVAGNLPAQTGRAVAWDSAGQTPGSYVFKAVVHDVSGTLATALSPGTVEIGAQPSPVGGCSSGDGPATVFGLLLTASLLARPGRRAARIDLKRAQD